MTLLTDLPKLREMEQGIYPGEIQVVGPSKEYLQVVDEWGEHDIARASNQH